MTLIGPEPVDVPRFVTPFRVEDHDTIVDANDEEIATVNPNYLFDEVEREVAQAIADALNEKFGGEPAKTTVTAEFYASKDDLEDEMYGRGYAWFVANDRAYYRYPDGEIYWSVFSPHELRTSGRFERRAFSPIDLSTLEGVEGTP